MEWDTMESEIQNRAGNQKHLARLPFPMLPISPAYYPCHPCDQWSKTPASIYQTLFLTVSFVQTTRLKASFNDAKLQLTTPNSSQRDLTTPDSEIISRPFAFFAGKVIEIWNFLFVSPVLHSLGKGGNFGFRASSFLPKGKSSQNKVKQGSPVKNFLPLPPPARLPAHLKKSLSPGPIHRTIYTGQL